MPRSPRRPPRRPIDDATLRRALAGEAPARTQVVRIVGEVIARAVAERLRDEGEERRPERSVQLVLVAWRSVVEDDFAVLRRWSSSQPCSFAEHVASVVCTWLDGPHASDVPSSSARAGDWTPPLVAAGLDDVHAALGRALVRDVYRHLRACAHHTLRSQRQRVDVTTEAQDLAHELASVLFDKDGAVLRRWDPRRGRTTLRSYLYLIARRDFVRRLTRARGRHGNVVSIDVFGERELPIAPEVVAPLSEELRLELAFREIRAHLDEDDRALLELMRKGASAKDAAATLGINGNAYYQRKHRLLQKMKAIMAKLDRRDP